MATEKRLISIEDCPCDGCKAKPCGHPARCVKFALWLNKTVDAVEVVHGRWEPHPDAKGYVRCSVCHDCIIYDDWVTEHKWYYCPNCGADMRERKDNDNRT